MASDYCNPRAGTVLADMAYDACKIAYADEDHWDITDLRPMLANIIRIIRREFREGRVRSL